MLWLIVILLIILILWIHFRKQRKSEYLGRASNYWIIVYVLGYFLPVPLFFEGEDGWSTIWGYSFSNFTQSLTYALVLATTGGIILSLAAAPRRWGLLKQPTRTARSGARQVFGYRTDYQLKPSRVFIVMAVSLGTLFVGLELVGGLWILLSGLGDRINLFAGLNAFFLPVNMLIGVCFALTVSRVTGGNVSVLTEWMAVGVTLPALFLLGQKSNIFILIVGIAIIRFIPRPDLKLRWVVLASFVLANLLMLYEYIFREVLIVGFDPERLTLSGWSTYLVTQITGNFMQIQNLTVLVESIPSIHQLFMGDTYMAVLAIPFPQAMVGVKPLTTAAAYTSMFWPDVVLRESTTMPPGLFGEAYLNFGVIGYLTVCLIIGLVLRMVDRPFQTGKSVNFMQIISIATFGSMALHFIRGEFFSPFLIFVGIVIGARATVALRRSCYVSRTPTLTPLSGPVTKQLVGRPSNG